MSNLSVLVAVPSDAPGGLASAPSAHFGHCACYTVAKIENGKIVETTIVQNTGHEEGGCATPVLNLAKQGVSILLCGGMGARPMMAMQQVGMSVYSNAGYSSVGDAIDAFIAGKLLKFGQDQICKGCGGHK